MTFIVKLSPCRSARERRLTTPNAEWPAWSFPGACSLPSVARPVWGLSIPVEAYGTVKLLVSLILWIDDDKEQLRLYSELLCGAGFRVITATNTAAAFDLLARNPVDLVVTDQNLPDDTAINVIAEIKRSRPNVPIVLFSGSEAPTETDCADLCLMKGATSPKELIAEITKLLSHD